MSVSAAIRRMLDAGLTIDQALIAAEAMETAFARPVDEQAERRRAADRERKRLRKSAETAELAEQVSPKKETSPTPPKEKTTPSQSEPNGSSKTPRQALECVLDSKRAGDVIDHRQRIRKPLTVRAAQLLASEFAKCPDPNAGADAMVLNGWQGFDPKWMDRQQPRGSPISTKPQTAQEILKSRREQGPYADDDRPSGTPRFAAIGHVS